MQLERQITLGGTRVQHWHFARVHSQIESSVRSVSETLRLQRWNDAWDLVINIEGAGIWIESVLQWVGSCQARFLIVEMELDLRGNVARVTRQTRAKSWESVEVKAWKWPARKRRLAQLFKKPCLRKNGYRWTEYRDLLRKIVAVVLMQIFRPWMKPEEVGTDDEWPSVEGLRHSKWKLTIVPAKDPLEEVEEQGGDTKVETLGQSHRLPRQSPVYTSSGKEYSEVLTELANTAVDPN